MREELNRLHDKVDKIDDRLDKIDKHLAVYNEQLIIHIKRTDLLEQDVRPIKTHVAQVSGVLKFIALTSTVVGIMLAVQTLMR